MGVTQCLSCGDGGCCDGEGGPDRRGMDGAGRGRLNQGRRRNCRMGRGSDDLVRRLRRGGGG
jgi:hypothetical protein